MNLDEFEVLSESDWQKCARLSGTPTLMWADPILDEKQYHGVPMLLDSKSRIVPEPTDWFLHLTVSNSAPKTVEKYAISLRTFWEFLGERKKSWMDTNDELLRLWRNQLEPGRKGGTINQRIDVVVAFLLWAQEQGYASNMVGETPPGGQPLPVRLVLSRGRHKRLVSVVRSTDKKPPRLPIPDHEEIDRLYARLTGPNEALSERNCRMADLAVEAGLRREEICSMKISAIPTRGVIAEFARKQKVHRVDVVGKGSKPRVVPVLPELMTRIRDHIEAGRTEFNRHSTHREDHVFLSKKTGRSLTGPYVSRFFSRAFGKKQLTLHRLRARYASLVVMTLARKEMKKRGVKEIRVDFVLRAAAEVLGHDNIETLRRYVDLAIKLLEAEAEGVTASSDVIGVDAEVLENVARQNRKKAPASPKQSSTSRKKPRRS